MALSVCSEDFRSDESCVLWQSLPHDECRLVTRHLLAEFLDLLLRLGEFQRREQKLPFDPPSLFTLAQIYVTLKQVKGGAQVIFHAVNSGSSQKYREHHESNLRVRSAEAKCTIVVVNAAHDEPINCASGVVNDFEYLVSLPRKGEVTQTVEFTPRYWYTSLTHSSDACILDSLPHN